MKRIFESKFLISDILLPIIALTVYCGTFAYISFALQLDGVNYVFASKLAKYSLLMSVGMGVICLVIFLFRKTYSATFVYAAEPFYFGDFILVLFPLTPVVQYIFHNQEILSPTQSIYVVFFFALFAVAYIFVLPMLLHVFLPTRTLTILGLAFVFTIASMASLSQYFAWFGKGSLRFQILLLGIIFLAGWFLYAPNNRKFLYFLIVVNFVANNAVPLLSKSTPASQSALSYKENNLLLRVGDRKPAVTPNIYLLVYDAYVPNETMLAYGIDNSIQEEYLRGLGFDLYPRTYSIAPTTANSMGKVLNVSISEYGNKRRAVSGDGVVQNILKNLGYKTYGLFPTDYMFQGIGSSYTYAIPKTSNPPYIKLLRSIFLGEFRFNIDDLEFAGQSRDQFIATKQSIFREISGNRVFVYMHSNVPSHSQNSGACLPNEIDLFRQRLLSANLEMSKDLQTIIANDPQAIVIVAGDHGPYLTKNCSRTTDVYDISEISRLDIQDRYGTFLAIKWSTGDFVKYDQITVLQDLFPAIFAYLYQDASILEAKIEPVIEVPNVISGVVIKNGVIYGGIDDGESLYLSNPK